MNAGTCWEQEYNRPNGLSVEIAPKSDLYLYLLVINKCVTAVILSNFSRHYLRKRSTLDIGVLGYIGVL